MTNYPKLIRIRQKFTPSVIDNITEKVKSEISNLKLEKKIKPGDSIAITAGSRGIADISTITKTVIDELIKLHGMPFIIPAMGSHGGATDEGQLNVLAGYGITEKSMGVPIKSSMEVVKIGDSEIGIPVYVDKNAIDADHIVVINRIKSHTRFVGEIESGLIKMLLVGLGKDAGAKIYHMAISKHTFSQIIESVLPVILSKVSVLFGLAIVENAYGNVANIQAVVSEDMFRVETMLKRESFELMAKLPFRDIDLLIIDEMGKDISGTGMDTNIIGRKDNTALQTQDRIRNDVYSSNNSIHDSRDYVNKTLEQESVQTQTLDRFSDEEFRIARIFVRDLTPRSHGNACGIGLADFTTRRLVDKINFNETYVNCVTGLRPEGAKIPMTFDRDKNAIDAAISTCGVDNTDDIKIVWIKNTLDLKKIIISEAYLDALQKRNDLEKISSTRELVFDSSGNLPLFEEWTVEM